jgi:hypothetical protein
VNSTPTPKPIERHDALIARADEGLAHAQEQIARAITAPGRTTFGRTSFSQTWPAITAWKAGAPGPCRLHAGGVHHCRGPGFAVVLRCRGQARCRPLGAAARCNAIIAAGKSADCRAARAIDRSSGRSRGGATANNGSTGAGNALASDRSARRRAGSSRSVARSDTVAANDGTRARGCAAKHRTAQGEPAANIQRPFKGR